MREFAGYELEVLILGNMSSSLGPSFKAKWRNSPPFLTHDEVYLYEEKYYEVNDQVIEVPTRNQVRYLNVTTNADGMVDQISFDDHINTSCCFKIDKFSVIAGFERNDFMLMLKVYVPTTENQLEIGRCCSKVYQRAYDINYKAIDFEDTIMQEVEKNCPGTIYYIMMFFVFARPYVILVMAPLAILPEENYIDKNGCVSEKK